MTDEELKNRFEVLRGMVLMYNGMLGFSESDYGKGVHQGIVSTLRSLGLDAKFNEHLKSLKEKQDDTVLPDRME